MREVEKSSAHTQQEKKEKKSSFRGVFMRTIYLGEDEWRRRCSSPMRASLSHICLSQKRLLDCEGGREDIRTNARYRGIVRSTHICGRTEEEERE